MPFISEIHYDTTVRPPVEFVEIALAAGEDPADYVVSFYRNNGSLFNVNGTGIVNGEVRLSDAAISFGPDPENPKYTIYTISSKNSNGVLTTSGTGRNNTEASYVALTNTTTNTVIDAYGVGSNATRTLIGGVANGATAESTGPLQSNGVSYQWDSAGNRVDGPITQRNAQIVCFRGDSPIETSQGVVEARDICVGMEVHTANGLQTVRWVGKRHFARPALERNSKLYPIRIRAGALGQNLPTRDLWLSRQHRVLVRPSLGSQLLGRPECLVAAVKLTAVPGIEIDTTVDEVDYVHIMFDGHEMVTVAGIECESLYLGKQSQAMLTPEAWKEIIAIFPDLMSPDYQPTSDYYIPDNKTQKAIVAMLQNDIKSRAGEGRSLRAHSA